MSEITKVDYETVEKENTVTICDVCTREDRDTIELVANPQVDVYKTTELVETYDDPERAQRVVDKKQMVESMPMGHSRKYGIAQRGHTTNAQGDAKVDICKSCFGQVFDSALPESEGEVSFDTGDIEVVESYWVDSDDISAIVILWILFCVVVTLANLLIL